MSATQALQYVTENRRHNAVVATSDAAGAGNPLRNQLAVFWLRHHEEPIHDEHGTEIDIEAALSAPTRIDEEGAPPAEIGQLERLVRLPLTGHAAALRLDTNAFNLGVLSANKGRLLVRDWIAVSISEVRDRLASFLAAARVVSPNGEESSTLPIPTLVKALGPGNAGISRALLRTAYLGTSPPEELLHAAVLRYRVPDKATTKPKERHAQERRRHALVAAMKLVLTYRRKEAETLEKLSLAHGDPAGGSLTPGERAYSCGRLLAICEEIQSRSQRSSGSRTNTTVADRFYGSASSTPAPSFGVLMRLVESAYLPKLRREGAGYDGMKELLESVLANLRQEDGNPGFPNTLKLRDQAEFALGFYHQRAQFRTDRIAALAARNTDRIRQS